MKEIIGLGIIGGVLAGVIALFTYLWRHPNKLVGKTLFILIAILIIILLSFSK